MSSHREAPSISKDPSADNTDVYAFVSPDKPNTVTLIANFIPFELPYGGPNFNEFADDVSYEIHVSNRGSAQADITYRFTFSTTIRNAKTFLYNVGPISSPGDATWNRPQTFRVERITNDKNGNQTSSTVLIADALCPPCNVGAHSTPDYPQLAAQTYYDLGDDRMVFAGQRADGFIVDLGSIFDLGDLRPFQSVYGVPPMLGNMPGVNGLRDLNVHTIALQLRITDLTIDGSAPKAVSSPKSVIGVWASAQRHTARVKPANGYTYKDMGAFFQVSRLGNPLVNEVINPMSKKDYWNSQPPSGDSQFAQYVLHPELAGLLPALYPGQFPNLDSYNQSGKPRDDLAAILLTGIPSGIVKGFQNYTGPTQADMLRLNVAVKPTKPADQNPIGLLAGDAAGFPNGRRPIDNVTAIELRAVAGLTIPLVDPSYTPDAAATVLTDGTTNDNTPYGQPFLHSFPYLSNPNSGFTSVSGTPGGDPS